MRTRELGERIGSGIKGKDNDFSTFKAKGNHVLGHIRRPGTCRHRLRELMGQDDSPFVFLFLLLPDHRLSNADQRSDRESNDKTIKEKESTNGFVSRDGDEEAVIRSPAAAPNDAFVGLVDDLDQGISFGFFLEDRDLSVS